MQMQWYNTMNENAYLYVLTYWLDVKCSQTISETHPTTSHNIYLFASS
jgi:hypothetical protein